MESKAAYYNLRQGDLNNVVSPQKKLCYMCMQVPSRVQRSCIRFIKQYKGYVKRYPRLPFIKFESDSFVNDSVNNIVLWLKIFYGEEMYLKFFLTDVLKNFAHVGHHPWLGKIIQNFDKVVWNNYEYITSSKDIKWILYS